MQFPKHRILKSSLEGELPLIRPAQLLPEDRGPYRLQVVAKIQALDLALKYAATDVPLTLPGSGILSEIAPETFISHETRGG